MSVTHRKCLLPFACQSVFGFFSSVFGFASDGVFVISSLLWSFSHVTHWWFNKKAHAEEKNHSKLSANCNYTNICNTNSNHPTTLNWNFYGEVIVVTQRYSSHSAAFEFKRSKHMQNVLQDGTIVIICKICRFSIHAYTSNDSSYLC